MIAAALTGGLRSISFLVRMDSLDHGGSDRLSLYHAAYSSASPQSLLSSSASLLARLGSHPALTTPCPEVCPALVSPFPWSPCALLASRAATD